MPSNSRLELRCISGLIQMIDLQSYCTSSNAKENTQFDEVPDNLTAFLCTVYKIVNEKPTN